MGQGRGGCCEIGLDILYTCNLYVSRLSRFLQCKRRAFSFAAVAQDLDIDETSNSNERFGKR